MIQARMEDGFGIITLDDAAHRNALTPLSAGHSPTGSATSSTAAPAPSC